MRCEQACLAAAALPNAALTRSACQWIVVFECGGQPNAPPACSCAERGRSAHAAS